MESWQLFEMEYSSGNPKVVVRVAKLVVLDHDFHILLEEGARNRSHWMRDAETSLPPTNNSLRLVTGRSLLSHKVWK